MESETNVSLEKDINNWQFSQSKLMTLPLDVTRQNYVRRNIKEAIFSVVMPTPLETKIKLVSYAKNVLINILDMDPDITKSYDFLEFIAGNKILPSSVPIAHRYGGHQFGFWAMQLGDGRAHLLGEYVNRLGERWELQLKGSGRTPYSRDADGRAVLRSSVREFLCSEAMYSLGIPTSRAGVLIVCDDPVLRDQFYNGCTKKERAAIVLRLAPSWFRFGSVEILARNKEETSLQKLMDFIINEHYPEVNMKDEDRYVQLFSRVARKTVDLAVEWQNVGFVHGVLNTDNMSMLGITIDYGPFGFVEAYDPKFIPNTSDKEGRYCLDKQLEIVIWNLEKLAEALTPLLQGPQTVQMTLVLQNLCLYGKRKLRSMYRKKLGLFMEEDDIDDELVSLLLQMMEDTGADFTTTFCQLGEILLCDLRKEEVIEKFWSLKRLSTHDNFFIFAETYQRRFEPDKDSQRQHLMRSVNPRYVLRNWMAQSAIEKAENDDFSEVNFLLEVLQRPYHINEEAEKKGYADPPPKWSYTIRVSCSS